MIDNDDTRFTPTEFMLRHRTATPSKKKGWRPMQATPENATRARLDAKHIARSNICPICHMAKPATGDCC